MNVSFRIKATGEHLQKEDYVTGFGLNTSHYFAVMKAREEYNKNGGNLPLRSDFKDDYELQVGTKIDGRPFNNRPHPWLGKVIKNTKTGETYVIEGVHKHFDYGYYWTIVMRREGTKSHGSIWWENINCRYETITKEIKKNRRRWIFV